MRATLSDPLLWLYPDSTVPEKPLDTFELDVAAATIADVNILLTGLKTGKPLSIRAEEKTGAIGSFSWFRFVDVPVEANTGADAFTERDGVRNEFVTRRAPFRVFDAMEPLKKKTLEVKAETTALRFQADIPDCLPPGKYEIALTVAQGDDVREFTFAVNVYDLSIYADPELKFPYTNWISYSCIGEKHGLKMWEGKFWDMLKRYARLMARGRQSAFLIPLSCIFENRDGEPVLNRKRLEKIVSIFTDAGLYIIEGGHFGNRTGGAWTAPTFTTEVVKELATSQAGCRVIASMASQLMEVIEENEWQERWIQHVTDEPIPQNAVDYRIFTGMVRRHMPGIPIIDATQAPDMPGSVDYWCPLVNHYEEHKEKFEEMRKTCGDGIWYYTCCVPGGKWLNRLLDNELLRPVLLGWGGALYNLDGFLHWGLNYSRADQDPFKMSCVPNWGGGTNSLPAGDTHIIYPGPDGPWPSARMEAMRIGMEDRDILGVLNLCDEKKSRNLISKVIRSFSDYSTDITVYRETRRKIIKAAADFSKLVAGEIAELSHSY